MLINKLILIFVFGLFSITLSAQLSTQFVQLNDIDENYSLDEDSIYVALNTASSSNHKLLVFLPGTGAKTKHYLLFPNLAANLGYHVIGLSYPNGLPALASICAGNSDIDCYKNYREEICFGHDVSENVFVDSLNSIQTRLFKTLQYLSMQYPQDEWEQFLNGNALNWQKMAFAGHSQGAGHALYLGKTNLCERVIMFAGADDFSLYYNEAANWISEMPNQTPLRHVYSFLHFNDDVWDYSKQFEVVKALGMTDNGDDSTLVDNISPPYLNSHCLYTALQPLYPNFSTSTHSGMVVDFFTPKNEEIPIYYPVWTYMLTHEDEPLDLSQFNTDASFLVYTTPILTIESAVNEVFDISLYNSLGQLIYKSPSSSFIHQIDTNTFFQGIYFIHIHNKNNPILIKKIVIT